MSSKVIASLNIQKIDSGLYEFTVSYGGQPVYADAGFSSVTDALIEANNYEGPIKGFEVSYRSFVIGTYLCEELKADPEGVADHALERYATLQEA